MRLSDGVKPTLLLLACCLVGCTPTRTQRAQSPLQPPRMSSSAVVLDIFFVRFPAGDPEINETLWQQLDEQQVEPDRRRELWENGFRAGVLTGPLPETLARMLELAGKPVAQGQPSQVNPLEATNEPKVARRHLQLQAGSPAQIVASTPQDVMTVLTRGRSGELGGREFYQAQPFLAVTAHPLPDGRVRLDLTPKVRHGRYLQRWTGDNLATLRPNPGQECITFDRLGVDVPLAPGDMLILSNLPALPGSLGHRFFTTTTEGVEEQKLLILRLSQTQHDAQFDPTPRPNSNADSQADSQAAPDLVSPPVESR